MKPIFNINFDWIQWMIYVGKHKQVGNENLPLKYEKL